jgi:putative ABC transport system permease protein
MGYGASQTTWGRSRGQLEIILGLAFLVPAVVLLAPFCLSLLGKAGRAAPVTVRLAWRDLARYRARSGSALAAISLAVLIAVIICVVAAARYANPLDYTGPNVAHNQLLVYTPGSLEGGPVTGSPATVQKTALAIAGLVGSHQVVELLTTSATLDHSGPGSNWDGPIYVATPELLAAFHVRSSEISPRADILSMRPGLANETNMQLVVLAPSAPQGAPPCQRSVCATPSGPFEPRQVGRIDRPIVQELGSLPSGTDAPNTLVTLHAVKQLGLRTSIAGWFLQAPQTINPAQLKSAQLMANAQDMSVEAQDNVPSMSTLINAATAFGIGLALAVLAMSVGLVRSETAGDLRVLAATGASSWARHMLSAATAGGLALLGALLGTFAGYVGMIGLFRGGTLAGGVPALGHVPVANLLLILVGMPAIAVVLGWALSGRERPATVRRAIE